VAGSLTTEGAGWRRFWSFLSGAGMIGASVLTIEHFYSANFPESIFRGSFCDINAFFNCDSSAYSPLAHFDGVPMGYLGLFAGLLAVLALTGAYGFQRFYEAKKEAQFGAVAMKIVKEYYSLAEVQNPSTVSPFWAARASERFEDAPIRVIEYADFLCPDCLFLHQQLKQLEREYRGKVNIAFQFFPLEAKCNTVVEKDLHPGACELSLMAAYDPAKFKAIHDEIFDNFQQAKSPEWRVQLARKHGVEAALNDQAVRELLQRIINTGAEYEKTSDRYSHGIRSTPTMIINNRMIIGTLPYAHLRAIFESLLSSDGRPGVSGRFMENWVDTRPKRKQTPPSEPK